VKYSAVLSGKSSTAENIVCANNQKWQQQWQQGKHRTNSWDQDQDQDNKTKTKTAGSKRRHLADLTDLSERHCWFSTLVMFQNQNRGTINSAWKVAVFFKIIMTTSVKRPCFTTQHQTCKTKTKTKTTACKTKTKTKTDFLVSDRSCPKIDGPRPHHWTARVQTSKCSLPIEASGDVQPARSDVTRQYRVGE